MKKRLCVILITLVLCMVVLPLCASAFTASVTDTYELYGVYSVKAGEDLHVRMELPDTPEVTDGMTKITRSWIAAVDSHINVDGTYTNVTDEETYYEEFNTDPIVHVNFPKPGIYNICVNYATDDSTMGPQGWKWAYLRVVVWEEYENNSRYCYVENFEDLKALLSNDFGGKEVRASIPSSVYNTLSGQTTYFDDFTFTESITLPSELYLTSQFHTTTVIPEGVIVTSAYGNDFLSDSLTINGTLDCYGYASTRDELKINGKLNVYANGKYKHTGYYHYNNGINITGVENAVALDRTAELLMSFDSADFQTIKAVSELAAENKGDWQYDVSTHYGTVWVSSDIVIPENMELNAHYLDINSGVTVTNNGEFHLIGDNDSFDIAGKLINNGKMQFSYCTVNLTGGDSVLELNKELTLMGSSIYFSDEGGTLVNNDVIMLYDDHGDGSINLTDKAVYTGTSGQIEYQGYYDKPWNEIVTGVDQEKYRVYVGSSGWTKIIRLAKIEQIASGTCGENLSWALTNDGYLTISGEGPMADYSASNSAPWMAYKDQIKVVMIKDGVTSVGDEAFTNCGSVSVLSLGKDVESIGYFAFAGCGNLRAVVLPEAVKVIEAYAFSFCMNLQSVTLPVGLETIENNAFDYCFMLASITIPNSVKYIGSSAFWSCSLNKIVFIGNAPDIDGNAFEAVTAAAYYPKGNPTWTEDKLQNYGGTITWQAAECAAHNWIDATCTEPKTCAVCGGTEGEPLGHDVSGGVCTRCGLEAASVTIITQPKTTYTQLGEKAKFTVKAEGEGLTYQWYYKDVDGKSYKKCSGTKATYSLEMTEARKDRELFCEITDKYGNSVKTESVFMRLAATVTSEPKTTYTELGEKAKFTVKADGDGLTYQWYYKDVDGTKYKKCSGTKATYSLEMTEARKDRKLYCVITDQYGNIVKTKTVTMKMAATITSQPKTSYKALDEKAKYTVKAVGDDLTYQWYYKSAGSSKYKKASCTKSTYTITTTEDRKDRAFYCVITDKYGNSVKTKTVYMRLAATIKTEPKSVKTSIGKKAKFTVKAVGDGLTYQWYYKDTDDTKYKKASGTKATYSIELTKARNGRKFYCVITDKYGNSVKTKTVSMKKK